MVHHVSECYAGIGIGEADGATATEVAEAMRVRSERAARHNDRFYHFLWPVSFGRNLALRAMGGRLLRARYGWIYGWRRG